MLALEWTYKRKLWHTKWILSFIHIVRIGKIVVVFHQMFLKTFICTSKYTYWSNHPSSRIIQRWVMFIVLQTLGIGHANPCVDVQFISSSLLHLSFLYPYTSTCYATTITNLKNMLSSTLKGIHSFLKLWTHVDAQKGY